MMVRMDQNQPMDAAGDNSPVEVACVTDSILIGTLKSRMLHEFV